MTSPAPFLFATGIENSYPRGRLSVPPRSLSERCLRDAASGCQAVAVDIGIQLKATAARIARSRSEVGTGRGVAAASFARNGAWNRAPCPPSVADSGHRVLERHPEIRVLGLADARVQRVSQCHVTRVTGQRRSHLAGNVRIADPGLRVGEAQSSARTR